MSVTVYITGQDSLDAARDWLAGHDWPTGLFGDTFPYELYEAIVGAVDRPAGCACGLLPLADCLCEDIPTGSRALAGVWEASA